MNLIERHLNELSPSLFSQFIDAKKEVTLLLNNYSFNFPTYTDHSINHTLEVFNIASDLLSKSEIEELNADETYILAMACILHDIGMCLPEDKISSILESELLVSYKDSHPTFSKEDCIRDIHHTLSNHFIQKEWELLKIPSKKYAKAIGIVAEGHRKVDLTNFDNYDPRYFPKNGKDFSCLPYLSCILRIADELDVTNSRTPKLLTKYYIPNNEVSVREWSKHIATLQRNYLDHKVIFEVDCSDQNIYAALQDQFDKIQKVINYCQKVIRSIPSFEGVNRKLNLSIVDVKYNFIGFDPKGIKFTFDIPNVVKAFIGEDLYNEKMTSLREAVQNAIDSCRYKKTILGSAYVPQIKVSLTPDYIEIEDNGTGMDEFVIENFFSRLGSSFYEQEKVKSKFEAIGQFGVGVFSYFLLSEYIDVETKTDSGRTLRFRFDSDPKGYFNFYTNTTRRTPGTTTRLYFKSSIKDNVELKEVQSYLEKLFRHIEFTLDLNLLGSKSTIESSGFKIDLVKQLKKIFKHQYKNLFDQIGKLEVSINDDSVEGVCYLLYIKEFQSGASKLIEWQDVREEESEVKVSQKGVFVTTFNSVVLSFFYGEINLKKKLKINIDRNEFSNENEVNAILLRFEVMALEKLFKLFQDFATTDQAKISTTRLFFDTYLGYLHRFMEYPIELKEIIKRHVFVEIIDNGIKSVCSISDLMEKASEVIILRKVENEISISQQVKKIAILSDGDMYRSNKLYMEYRSIFGNLLRFKAFLEPVEDSIYFGYNFDATFSDSEENIERLRDLIENEIVEARGSKLVYELVKNKENEESFYTENRFINYNHYLIGFINRNFEKIESETKFKKVINSMFDYIDDNFDAKVSDEFIEVFNKLMDPLNEIEPIKKVSREDF